MTAKIEVDDFSEFLSKQAALSQNGTGPKDAMLQAVVPIVPTEEQRAQWIKEQTEELGYLNYHKIIGAFESIASQMTVFWPDPKVTVTDPSSKKQQPIEVKLEYGHKIIADQLTCHVITLAVAREEDGEISGVRFTTSTAKSKILPPDPDNIYKLIDAHIRKSFENPTPQKPTVYMPDLAMV